MLSAQAERRWGAWESLSLAGYAALVSFGIAHHEGWADEGQAWLLARDSGWWQLMLHGLHHEGSPGLWHTLLWLLVRLHCSYAGMHWVAGALATAGVFVLLRYAPFPRILNLLLPFTFWIAYQDAVVARSYVLYALLGFGAAALLRRQAQGRGDSPILLAVLLGLIANISAHGGIAAFGLGFVMWMQAARRGKRVGYGQSKGYNLHRYVAAIVLLAAFCGVSVMTSWPPADQDFAISKLHQKAGVWESDAHGRRWVYGRDAIPVENGADQPHIVTRAEAATSLTMQPGELAPMSKAAQHRHRPWLERQLLTLSHVGGALTYPISRFRLLGLAAVVLLIALACSNKREGESASFGWLALVPYGLTVAAFSHLYLAPRHSGMLFTTFLISAWLAWPAPCLNQRRQGWQQAAFVAVMLLVIGDQVIWTAKSLVLDSRGDYSGDRATAQFLGAVPQGSKVAGFYFHATGTLAYLDRVKYMNQPESYWLWSSKVRVDQDAPFVLAEHPDYIVVGGFSLGPEMDVTADWVKSEPENPVVPLQDDYRIAVFFKQHGYVETHRFCGTMVMRASYTEKPCNIILEPASAR